VGHEEELPGNLPSFAKWYAENQSTISRAATSAVRLSTTLTVISIVIMRLEVVRGPMIGRSLIFNLQVGHALCQQ
jgi:hypothetical protein